MTTKVDNTETMHDCFLPHHVEAEQAVLCCLLSGNDTVRDVIDSLSVEDFYLDAHQVIFAAIRDLCDACKSIDMVILKEQLERQGQRQFIAYVSMLANKAPDVKNAKYYAEIIRDKAVKRQLIESATEILRDGYSNQFTAQELLESAARKVNSIGVTQQEKSDPYKDYLVSLEWKGKRNDAIERAKHRCQVCYTGDIVLDVHHRTYERIGREEPEDLTVLCRDCHRLFHKNGKLARPYGRSDSFVAVGS